MTRHVEIIACGPVGAPTRNSRGIIETRRNTSRSGQCVWAEDRNRKFSSLMADLM